MDQTLKIKASFDSMAMYESLRAAIDQTGGTGESFSPKNLRTMTVAELIADLAPNGIRFHHVQPAKDIRAFYRPLEDYEVTKEMLAKEKKCMK